MYFTELHIWLHPKHRLLGGHWTYSLRRLFLIPSNYRSSMLDLCLEVEMNNFINFTLFILNHPHFESKIKKFGLSYKFHKSKIGTSSSCKITTRDACQTTTGADLILWNSSLQMKNSLFHLPMDAFPNIDSCSKLTN